MRPLHIKDKVKVLTVIGKPIGVITKEYSEEMDGEAFYWVRMKRGILLKDVSINEIEYYE